MKHSFNRQLLTTNENPLESSVDIGWGTRKLHNAQVKYLDKLVDEVAKGKKMEKILREV